MEIWRQPENEVSSRYFDGRDSFIDGVYLRKKLCKKKYRLEYEKGELLIAQGDAVDSCYFIDSGSVILYEIHNGKRRIMDACGKNTFLFADQILYDHPSACNVEAREKTVVYTISITKARLLMRSDNQFLTAMFAQQTRNVLVCMDLLSKSINHNVGWLISDFLLVMAMRNGQASSGITYLNDRYTQQQIADMLFINRITCFKELHSLEAAGLIDMQTNRIGIKDIKGLADYRDSCADEV